MSTMANPISADSYVAMLEERFGLWHALDIGPQWLREKRAEAMAEFLRMGLPGRKSEEWKYTPIAPRLRQGFEPRRVPSTATADEATLEAAQVPGLDANRLVFVNGRFVPELSDWRESGVQFLPLSDEGALDSDLLQFATNHVVNHERDPFVWLNQALWQDGVLIDIPDNTTLKRPVYLVYVEQEDGQSALDQVRNIVRVGRNSHVQFIQNYLNHSGNDRNLANHFTQVFVADNAQVEWYNLQYHLDDGMHLSQFEVEVGRDARFSTYTFTTSGALVRNVAYIKLAGTGSDARMYGLYQLAGEEHVDNRTLVDHATPHCTSDELFKGVMNGKATAVFNGKIIVRPDAQKTNAFQHNPNILLSDDATVYSKPQLEIFADDVKCSHGATSGQLDEEALFYLRQRGLSLADAKGLLVYAFANDVVEKVNVPALRDYLQKILQGNLHIH